jgi:hypothetical protein
MRDREILFGTPLPLLRDIELATSYNILLLLTLFITVHWVEIDDDFAID